MEGKEDVASSISEGLDMPLGRFGGGIELGKAWMLCV